MSPRSTARTWLRRGVQAALLAGLVLDTAALRRRVAALRTLPERPAPGDDRYRLLHADGVTVDGPTLNAARAHAKAEGLCALELVPRDLPTAQALDLLRTVDPATYRTDRQAKGAGAWHAVLADDGVLRAVGYPAEHVSREAAELGQAAAKLKLHAPDGTDLVVSPRLTSAPEIVEDDARILARLLGRKTGGELGPRLGWLAILAGSSVLGPGWAAALLAAWSAQPAVVFAGSRSLKPVDLFSYSLRRVVAEPKRLLAAMSEARLSTSDDLDPVTRLRPDYLAELADGVDRFFEPRRRDCPWCGSANLVTHLKLPDLLQHKPGEFTLDRCRACTHIFQNPRLTIAGLDFYYRDFYDGLGEDKLDKLFAARGIAYRPRAEMLKPFAEPESWLDVGTGHGHFCNAAREVWPQTTFDGLDITEGVELAEHRGWVDRGYRGLFPELAADIHESYDVVSMYHYLEHSRDPRQELEAALKVLKAGGHLMIEVPDPESRWGKLLGKWWLPWLQPQHLHFVPIGNLREALSEMGFTVVAEQRGEPHEPIDLVGAAWNAVNHFAPRDDVPWAPQPPTAGAKAGRAATMIAAAPALLTAALTDRVLSPLSKRYGGSSAYRLLARKD
ncbi:MULTISPECIES: class I SAM-dependent methyltransferase [unclassified Crossiella]|uniref:class I SAM-dependent methyltransferase n=1 Tax=unclassified Crossiella TaxID=2620835 RepID=UPI001FFFC98E|nr:MULTISPECIES: class I SAM-dependent methyltransferase [unclassified Crossiella]MCK2243120.1 class I SAM-dependent methyltransferase [Crossiella sp. S99.2]MCK2256997.1 class I SAM-dependent methyltransferase [Crossiella sp. S99.1]